METADGALRSLLIADQIKPMLAGLGPEIQGAVLSELVSVWLGGFEPSLRDEALAHWLDAVRLLTPLNDPRRKQQ